MSLAVLQRVMCVVRNLSTIVLRSCDGSCVLSLSRIYGSENRTGIVKSPSGVFDLLPTEEPVESCIARCHFPCRGFDKLEHDDKVWLKRFLRTWVAPSRVILLCQRNEVPFYVPMVIANGHEESSRYERHLFHEMDFWRKNETCIPM